MLSRNNISFWLIALFALTLTGCGSDDNPNNSAVAPPGGGFSNSSLNGTYVFSFSGYDRTNGKSRFVPMISPHP